MSTEWNDGLDEELVRQRAYEIHKARGGGEGYELDDWLQAEAELRERRQLGVAGQEQAETAPVLEEGWSVPAQSGGIAEDADKVLPDVEDERETKLE